MNRNKNKENNENGINNDTLCAEYGAVFRYVLSLTHNEQEAEDITQDVFLRALSAKESFSGDSSLYTWLCSIAKNQLINRQKKQKRNAGSDPLDNMPDSSLSIEEQIADHSSAMQIMRVLHTIEEPYKEVFSLRVFGQLDFKDLGSLFGKTDSWARVTYYRAKEKIRQILRKEGML